MHIAVCIDIENIIKEMPNEKIPKESIENTKESIEKTLSVLTLSSTQRRNFFMKLCLLVLNIALRFAFSAAGPSTVSKEPAMKNLCVLMHNSSFLVQTSSFLMQTSLF